MQDHPKSILRSMFHFLSGTVLSRITGLAREVAMAFCFGASASIAAFFVGFRFANLMRRLFGEGSLLAGFSPHFEEIKKSSDKEAAYFFRDLFFSLVLFLSVFVGVAEVVLFCLWKWSGFSSDAKEILFLTLLMLPGVVFICLYALFSAFLQNEKRYFLAGFAPVMFNLIMIAAIFSFDAMTGLSAAVVVAFFGQWLMVAPKVIHMLSPLLSWREWLQARFFSPPIQQMVKAIALTVMGVGAVQINAALDAVFARFTSLSGPAFLNYAVRLYQLPLALFGVALASALLPPLVRAIKAEERKGLLQFALNRSFALMMPCTIGIFVLGASAVNLIYGHGDFDAAATIETTRCLWAYGIGLVPAVFVLLLAPAFYSEKNYRTPLVASLLSVGLNTGLNILFVFGLGWGSASIAAATALSAAFNSYYLASKLPGKVFDKAALFAFLKVGLAALVAGITTLFVGAFLIGDPSIKIAFSDPTLSISRNFFTQSSQFFVLAGTFALMFLAYAWAFNAGEILQFMKYKGKIEGNEQNLL